jgi:hypothetical protein
MPSIIIRNGKKKMCYSSYVFAFPCYGSKDIPYTMSDLEGGISMYGYGAFGGYTRWAVVFLIIFVLFFLLVPYYAGGSCAGGVY